MKKIDAWMAEYFGEWPWCLTTPTIHKMAKVFPIFQINLKDFQEVEEYLTELPNDVYYYDFLKNIVIFESQDYAVEFKLRFGDANTQIIPEDE